MAGIPLGSPRSRWLWLGVSGVLFLFAAGYVAWLAVQPPLLFSDPARVRRSAEHDRVFRVRPMPPTEVAPFQLPVLTTTTNGSRTRITYPTPAELPSRDAVTFDWHRLALGQTARVGQAELWVRQLGLSAPPAAPVPGKSSYQPATFFGPDLKLLSEPEVLRRMPNRWERELQVRPQEHTVRFDLGLTNTGPAVLLEAWLFDARTRAWLTRSRSSRHLEDGVQLDFGVLMWHAGPVDCVVDLAFGEVETQEIEPRVGAKFEAGLGTECTLIHAGSAGSGYWGSGGIGTNTYLEFEAPAADKPGSMFLFRRYPPAAQSPFRVEFLRADGRPLPGGGGSAGSDQLLYEVRAGLGEVARIRIQRFRSAHRFVLSLPRLPGPAVAVDNLFAVRIPSATVNSQDDLEHLIERSVQLDLAAVPGPAFPPGYFPRTFTNTTPAELLQEIARHRPVPGEAYVDEASERILFRRPLLQELRERAEKLLKR